MTEAALEWEQQAALQNALRRHTEEMAEMERYIRKVRFRSLFPPVDFSVSKIRPSIGPYFVVDNSPPYVGLS